MMARNFLRTLMARSPCLSFPAAKFEMLVSHGRLQPVDFNGSCLDPGNKLATEFNRIVERVETADQKRTDAQSVILQDRLGNLRGRTDQARGIAQRAGHARN